MNLRRHIAVNRSEDTRFWNMFDNGASIAELAAAFNVPASEVRQYLHLPQLPHDCEDPEYEDELNDLVFRQKVSKEKDRESL